MDTKIALITGGSRGIGGAISVEMAAALLQAYAARNWPGSQDTVSKYQGEFQIDFNHH